MTTGNVDDRLGKVRGRAIICGPMRNGVQYLTGVRENMEKIGSFFDDYRIIIVESDSDDGSPHHLGIWAKENDRMEFESLGKIRDSFPWRTHRLALARNWILDIINRKYSDWYDDPDTYMVMMDPDDICFYPIDGFLSSWESEVGDDWEVMTANQKEDYYDIWALRGNGCDYDCWIRGTIEGLPFHEIKEKYVTPHTVPIPPGPPIRVDSAFGGLGIYKMRAIKGCRYVGDQEIDGKKYEVADHVGFHEQIRNRGGRVYINTRLYTNNGT